MGNVSAQSYTQVRFKSIISDTCTRRFGSYLDTGYLHLAAVTPTREDYKKGMYLLAN